MDKATKVEVNVTKYPNGGKDDFRFCKEMKRERDPIFVDVGEDKLVIVFRIDPFICREDFTVFRIDIKILDHKYEIFVRGEGHA
jgi:hypothetical protein